MAGSEREGIPSAGRDTGLEGKVLSHHRWKSQAVLPSKATTALQVFIQMGQGKGKAYGKGGLGTYELSEEERAE